MARKQRYCYGSNKFYPDFIEGPRVEYYYAVSKMLTKKVIVKKLVQSKKAILTYLEGAGANQSLTRAKISLKLRMAVNLELFQEKDDGHQTLKTEDTCVNAESESLICTYCQGLLRASFHSKGCNKEFITLHSLSRKCWEKAKDL